MNNYKTIFAILFAITTLLVTPLLTQKKVQAACSGTMSCCTKKDQTCTDPYGDSCSPVDPDCSCKTNCLESRTDACGDWYADGGCYPPPLNCVMNIQDNCSATSGGGDTGGGTGGLVTPTPVSGGGTGECSTGNMCDTTWAGTCCDSGCPHTWAQGFDACAGGGGGGTEPEPFSCTETTVCADGRRCEPGKKCVAVGDGSYRCEIKPICVRCSVSLSPDPLQVTVGSTTTLTGRLTRKVPDDVPIQDWRFRVGNSNIIRSNNSVRSGTIYTTNIRGMAVGTTTARLEIDLGYDTCNDQVVVNVIQPSAWWQVVDGDVITNGSLVSSIPTTCSAPNCDPVLIKPGSGGYPGVASFGTNYDFSAATGQGSASTLGWLAQSGYTTQNYNYAFFANLIPKDTVFNSLSGSSVSSSELSSGGTASSDGFYWYRHTGDLTINSALTMPSNRKVVLLVEGGNINLTGNTLVNNNNSLFFAVAGKDTAGNRGNITISSTTNRVEGLYLAEGSFITGSSNQQLNVRGSVAALEGFFLQRDLGSNNSNNPAHVFTFEPVFMFVFPKSLSEYDFKWQEVSP